MFLLTIGSTILLQSKMRTGGSDKCMTCGNHLQGQRRISTNPFSCYRVLVNKISDKFGPFTRQRESKRSPFFSLHMIEPYLSFPVDIMQLHYNVSKDMLSIWLSGIQDDVFNLSSNQRSFVESQLICIDQSIPSSIGNRLPPLSLYKRGKQPI